MDRSWVATTSSKEDDQGFDSNRTRRRKAEQDTFTLDPTMIAKHRERRQQRQVEQRQFQQQQPQQGLEGDDDDDEERKYDMEEERGVPKDRGKRRTTRRKRQGPTHEVEENEDDRNSLQPRERGRRAAAAAADDDDDHDEEEYPGAIAVGGMNANAAGPSRNHTFVYDNTTMRSNTYNPDANSSSNNNYNEDLTDIIPTMEAIAVDENELETIRQNARRDAERELLTNIVEAQQVTLIDTTASTAATERQQQRQQQRWRPQIPWLDKIKEDYRCDLSCISRKKCLLAIIAVAFISIVITTVVVAYIVRFTT